MHNSLDTQNEDTLRQSSSGAISYRGLIARPWSENRHGPYDTSKQNTLELAHKFYESASLPEILEHLFPTDINNEIIPSLAEISDGFKLASSRHFMELMLAKNPEIAERYDNLSIASGANGVYGVGNNPLMRFQEGGVVTISFFSEEGRTYKDGHLVSDDRAFYTDRYRFDIKTGDMEYINTSKETKDNAHTSPEILDRAPETPKASINAIQSTTRKQSQDIIK